MEVSGRIKAINPVQDVTATFKKRELVVTTEEQYPQHILIEFVQDKVGLLDQFNMGEQVKVSINLQGREWVNPQGETKYFNSIRGWRIERLQAEAPVSQTQQVTQPQVPPVTASQAFEPAQKLNEEAHDDLPF